MNIMANGIKVNASDWNNLSADDQTRINNLIASTFGEAVTPDANEPSVGGAGALTASGAGAGLQAAGLCKILCQVAKAAADVACQAVPPIGAPICLAAAQAGYNFCISKC